MSKSPGFHCLWAASETQFHLHLTAIILVTYRTLYLPDYTGGINPRYILCNQSARFGNTATAVYPVPNCVGVLYWPGMLNESSTTQVPSSYLVFALYL